MERIDWIATAQLAVFLALCLAGIVSGIRASVRIRLFELERRRLEAESYMQRVDQYQRDVFYDPFD
ncbi:hypothetical protein QE400_002580 [Xanthomonas sacchari]|uniref:hypothetical protein n=1 Tax=Xanthomonas sacchari TaxID=56458 RepID=UPI002785E595|nr:hypothetical protein [Xanthomonas sacchari]MDQ1093167.1 hypothetical protein [Xanthomonas sacchari]